MFRLLLIMMFITACSTVPSNLQCVPGTPGYDQCRAQQAADSMREQQMSNILDPAPWSR